MYERYRVEQGDTLSLIAKKFGTNENMLKSINDIYFLNRLKSGVDIIVPRKKELYYDVSRIKDGISIYNYSKENNINPNLLISLNGLEKDDYLYKGQEIIVPKKNYSYYISKEGDTLDLVARTFNISKDRLLSQNQTLYLMPGQIVANKKIN